MSTHGRASNTTITTRILLALVFLDFFSVSLVMSNLQAYISKSGIEASLLSVMSSTYMIAQLVGTLVGGAMADAVSKRTILLLSFVASAASYLLILLGSNAKSFALLFASRILVGLFKQTLTVCTLSITELEKEAAATSLGHVSALTTTAFVIGPLIGSFLYKKNSSLPCIVAATIFVINAVCTLAFLPSHLGMPPTPSPATPTALNNDDHEAEDRGRGKLSTSSSFLISKISELRTNFAYFANLPNVGRLLALRLLLMAAESAVSSRHIISYNERRYGIETWQLGFLSSFRSIVSITGDVFILPIVLRLNAMNDASFVVLLVFATSIFHFVENFSTNLYLTLAFSSLPLSFISSVLGAKLKTIQLVALPKGTAGKFLGIFSLLSTGIGIVSPLYAGFMYTKIDGVAFQPMTAAGHILLVGFFALIFPLTSLATNGEKENRNEEELDTPEELLRQENESMENKKDK